MSEVPQKRNNFQNSLEYKHHLLQRLNDADVDFFGKILQMAKRADPWSSDQHDAQQGRWTMINLLKHVIRLFPTETAAKVQPVLAEVEPNPELTMEYRDKLRGILDNLDKADAERAKHSGFEVNIAQRPGDAESPGAGQADSNGSERQAVGSDQQLRT